MYNADRLFPSSPYPQSSVPRHARLARGVRPSRLAASEYQRLSGDGWPEDMRLPLKPNSLRLRFIRSLYTRFMGCQCLSISPDFCCFLERNSCQLFRSPVAGEPRGL